MLIKISVLCETTMCSLHFLHLYQHLLLLEPLNEASLLETVQSHSCSSGSNVGAGSAAQKRKYATMKYGFPESNTSNSTSGERPPLTHSGKKPFAAEQGHSVPSMYSSVGLSQNPHMDQGHSQLLNSSAHHMVALGSTSSHHPVTMFPHSHFPNGGTSQQAMYEGRKVLMCSLNNCCCSSAAAACARPPYQVSDSFPSMTAQDFPQHAQLPANQPLQHFPMRRLLDASAVPARHLGPLAPMGCTVGLQPGIVGQSNKPDSTYVTLY